MLLAWHEVNHTNLLRPGHVETEKRRVGHIVFLGEMSYGFGSKDSCQRTMKARIVDYTS
jgi:hypothetical protein